ADEGVRGERDRNRREQEGERHRAPNQARRRDAVQRHRSGRRHDPNRERDRFPEAELAPERAARACLDRRSFRRHYRSPFSKMSSGKKAPTTQLGASTSSWMRRSTATLQSPYASSRSRPRSSTSRRTVARTASLAASIRSGPTPVQT